MHRTVEAIVEADGRVRLLEDVRYLPGHCFRRIFCIALPFASSSTSLSK